MTDFKIVTVSHLRFLHAATAILPNHCLVNFLHYPMFPHLFAFDTCYPSLSEARGNMGYYSDKMSKRLLIFKCLISHAYILKAVRYDRKCFHDSLKRTAVILGNEKLP